MHNIWVEKTQIVGKSVLEYLISANDHSSTKNKLSLKCTP